MKEHKMLTSNHCSRVLF